MQHHSAAHLVTPPQWEGLPPCHHAKWNNARWWGHQMMDNEQPTDEWDTSTDNDEQQTTMTDKWQPTTTWTTNIEHPAAPPTNDEEQPAPPTGLHEHYHHPPAPTTNGKEGIQPPPTTLVAANCIDVLQAGAVGKLDQLLWMNEMNFHSFMAPVSFQVPVTREWNFFHSLSFLPQNISFFISIATSLPHGNIIISGSSAHFHKRNCIYK